MEPNHSIPQNPPQIRPGIDRAAWSEQQIEEAAQVLVATYGPKAQQRLIDITQNEIRKTGSSDAIPHDEIVARIRVHLAEHRPTRA